MSYSTTTCKLYPQLLAQANLMVDGGVIGVKLGGKRSVWTSGGSTQRAASSMEGRQLSSLSTTASRAQVPPTLRLSHPPHPRGRMEPVLTFLLWL